MDAATMTTETADTPTVEQFDKAVESLDII